jgi:hypothetical protein
MRMGNNMHGIIKMGNTYIVVLPLTIEKREPTQSTTEMIQEMPRCETCGRVLTIRGTTEDVHEGEKSFHFCSVQCKDAWRETLRRVSVSH